MPGPCGGWSIERKSPAGHGIGVHAPARGVVILAALRHGAPGGAGRPGGGAWHARARADRPRRPVRRVQARPGVRRSRDQAHPRRGPGPSPPASPRAGYPARRGTPGLARMAELAAQRGPGAVLANAVRYLEPADSMVAQVLDAARHLVPLGSPAVTAREPAAALGGARQGGNSRAFLADAPTMAAAA